MSNLSADTIIIALDAMGGDNAPSAMLEGAEEILRTSKRVRFLLYGDAGKLNPIISRFELLKHNSTVHHTDIVIASDEKPSVAMRKGRGSSMTLAIDAVKSGKAHAVVSAGNTGALMAIAKLVLRTLPGIDRPAITSLFPTLKGQCVFLDLGANVDCNSDNLVQFAVMGDAFAKVILDLREPKVALLNVGSEDIKGSEVVKTAAQDLKEGVYPINFYGYVEGDDIAKGTADVVVTDGFTGNIALKTAEGTAKICMDYIKKALRSSPIAMLGALLVKSAFQRTFKKMDPRLHNGAMFLGLNGIVVKSHGSSDAIGNANAIKIAYELAYKEINRKIVEEMDSFVEMHAEGFFEEECEVEDGG